LKREFALDDEELEDLKSELIDAKHVAVDEDGRLFFGNNRTPTSAKEGLGETLS
jgi:hypothetical protein